MVLTFSITAAIVLLVEVGLWLLFSRKLRSVLDAPDIAFPLLEAMPSRGLATFVIIHTVLLLTIIFTFLLWTW